MAGAALRGFGAGIVSAGTAAGSAVKEKAIGSPGAYAGSIMGLANAKLDQSRLGKSGHQPPLERNDKS
jgi:type IV secretion system protein TrbL